jgi:hypothetical protein
MSDIDRRSTVGRVLDSNETRLETLNRCGVPVIVDSRSLLEFFFVQTLATEPDQFRQKWAVNVARLLDQVDAERRSAWAV